jgi:hypothetical protein
MKIVILQQDSIHHGNASWSCMRLPTHSREELFQLMGHKVVEVTEEEGERILKEMGQAIMLQVELRDLFYQDKNKLPAIDSIAAEAKATVESGNATE